MKCIGKVEKIILFENASSQLLHINSLYETEAQPGNSHANSMAFQYSKIFFRVLYILNHTFSSIYYLTKHSSIYKFRS